MVRAQLKTGRNQTPLTSELACSYPVTSPQSCINEWQEMDDLLVRRPPSPGIRVEVDAEVTIKIKLREIMKVIQSCQCPFGY